MKRSIFAFFLIAAFYQFAFAQNFDKAKLDRYFQTLDTNSKFMGSVAVSQNGEIIYRRSIGFAEVEHKIKATELSKYRIGSISKTFTTVLIFKAIEAKMLTLDQTIDKYFPMIPNAKKITIRHLLMHRSGIPSFTNDPDYLTWNTQPKSEKEMLDIMAKAGSDFEPDSKAAYSNSNFVLLSYLLEKLYRKKYPELLQKYIIQPLELTNTYFGGKIDHDHNECRSYKYLGTWMPETETDMSIPSGAGGIVSNPTDLTRFCDALFGGKLLKPESLERMKEVKDGYGMGLIPIPFYTSTGYGHTGAIDAFSSVFVYFPDGKISYALISNGSNYNINNISIAVMSAIYDRPYDIPEFSSYSLSPDELNKYLGVYSTEQIPLEITISRNNNTLIAQASGQPSFPLEASGKDQFKYDQAGVVLEFNPDNNSMILKQGGGVITFKRK